jgi:hypothetical protein
MTLDELLILPADAIDYAALPTALLVDMATQNEEPFIATNALGELLERKAIETWDAAAKIVLGGEADRHLVTYGLETLWGLDVGRSIEIMLKTLEQTSDPKILGAMIQAVLVYPAQFEAGRGLELRDALATRMRRTRPDEFTNSSDWKKFVDRYGQ